jgi:hypothetical protein
LSSGFRFKKGGTRILPVQRSGGDVHRFMAFYRIYTNTLVAF